jgi:LmbE family N-acetylglucosaminyl deacetylase
VSEVAGIDELIQGERHVFISPHYDDIALSCGGTVVHLSEAGRAPEVALIFGDYPGAGQSLTNFAAGMHEDWGFNPSVVIESRRKEETAAAAVLGTLDRYLPFRDAIYRGDRYTSNLELFGTVSPDEAGLPRQIVSTLGLNNETKTATRLYAPLAIGNHVDHQQAFLAGVELADSGWDVWFYEDLSYALRAGSREERFGAIGRELHIAAVIDVRGTWEKKLEAIYAYPSQLPTVFGYVDAGSSPEEIDDLMREYASAVGDGVLAERFWKVKTRE